jgi:hypothetical protein
MSDEQIVGYGFSLYFSGAVAGQFRFKKEEKN